MSDVLSFFENTSFLSKDSVSWDKSEFCTSLACEVPDLNRLDVPDDFFRLLREKSIFSISMLRQPSVRRLFKDRILSLTPKDKICLQDLYRDPVCPYYSERRGVFALHRQDGVNPILFQSEESGLNATEEQRVPGSDLDIPVQGESDCSFSIVSATSTAVAVSTADSLRGGQMKNWRDSCY